MARCDQVFHGVRLSDAEGVVQFPSGDYTVASVVLLGETAVFGTFSDDVVAVNIRAQQVVWRYQHPRLR